MNWTLVKQLHVVFALLTATSFALRGHFAVATIHDPWIGITG